MHVFTPVYADKSHVRSIQAASLKSLASVFGPALLVTIPELPFHAYEGLFGRLDNALFPARLSFMS